MGHASGENRLLGLLPARERERISRRLQRLEMKVRAPVVRAGEPIRYVYFPVSGVVSLVASTAEGWQVEVATIGNEGMVGPPAFVEAGSVPLDCFWQVPGEADRLPVEAYQDELRRGGGLLRVAERYTQTIMVQMAQSVACNRLHSLEQRAARWLCHTHDRIGGDQFPLTQEFFAMMLGVHRPSVTIAAGVLQKAGFISYGRGIIRVLDRGGLEASACECYGIVTEQFDRLLLDLGGDTRWRHTATA